MFMFKRELWASCVVGVLIASGTALAQAPQPQEPPPDPNVYPEDPNYPEAPPPAEPEADVDVDAPTTVIVEPQPQPVYTPTYEPEPVQEEPMMSRLGFAISAGGGVSDFTDSDMRDTTKVGGSWDVRASIGTRQVLGFEGSYIGSAQEIEALGLDDDSVLVGNGLQGALRLNMTTDLAVQPFLYGGVAWRHYELASEGVNTSAINDEDDVLEIPVGVGIAGKWRGFMVDARGEFRYANSEDMVPDLGADFDEDFDAETDGFANMHRWGVTANIGYEF